MTSLPALEFEGKPRNLGHLPGKATRLAKARLAPFTMVPVNHQAAIDNAARRVAGAPWMRSSTPAWALKVYVTLRRMEWGNRRQEDYVPGVINGRADQLAAELGINGKTLQRAVRLLVEAGLLEVKRRGACHNHQASCVGSCWTFPDQVVPNHPSIPKDIKKEEERASRDLRIRAAKIRERVFGRCPHETPCRDYAGCLDEIVWWLQNRTG